MALQVRSVYKSFETGENQVTSILASKGNKMSILCECNQTGIALWIGEGCLCINFPCRVFSVFLPLSPVAIEIPTHYNLQ